MSHYAVGLTTEAEDNLADIWLDATDRQSVTEAETAIYRLLSDDPIGNGTPVAEGLSKITYSPLVAFYSVDQGHGLVEISRFWRPH